MTESTVFKLALMLLLWSAFGVVVYIVLTNRADANIDQRPPAPALLYDVTDCKIVYWAPSTRASNPDGYAWDRTLRVCSKSNNGFHRCCRVCE